MSAVRDAPRPGSVMAGLHLAVLVQLAVSQPIFDLLVRHPAFLVAHRARPLDLLIFIVVVAALVPAVPVLATTLLARWSPRAAAELHLATLAVLTAVVALPPIKKIAALPSTGHAALAAIAGLAAALLYRRYAGVRSVLSALTPALVIFPAVFVLAEHVRPIAFPPSLAAARAVAVASDAPVVMVVFDELSLPTLLTADGAIDAERFPGFAALAERAVWYRRATTVADSTSYAIPALLTGSHPDRDRVPTAAGYPHNLFTLLAGHYRLRVFETLTELCPWRLCAAQETPDGAGPGGGGDGVGARLRALLADSAVIYLHAILPAAWAADLPPVRGQWRHFRHDEVTADQVASFERFLDAVRHAEDRTLYFLHVVLPHTPWQYLPSGRRYGCGTHAVPGLENDRWRDDDWLRLQGVQRYLMQTAFTDRLLAELLAVMDRTGLDDRALLAVTADHGIGFVAGEHWRLVAPANARSVASVPFFLRLPGAPAGGRIDDRPVENVDLMPTLIEALGIEPPPAWPGGGRSLLAPAGAREALKVRRSSNRLGPLFTFPPERLHGADEGIRPLLDAFAPGADGLFRIRRHDHLVGRRLGAARRLADRRASARLDPRSRTPRFDPEAERTPACITGSVVVEDDGRGDRYPVAVAVNGRIAALTRTFRDRRGALRFHALVPEDAFAAGGNQVKAVVLAADAFSPPPR